MLIRRVLCGVLVLAGALVAPAGFAQEVPGCGSLQNHYGPYDYRDPANKRDKLPIVEQFHFTHEVEALIRGRSTSVVGDLDYTLRTFPNHHRALNAVGKYSLQGGHDWPNEEVQSAECYFERAVAFRPDDEMTRIVYGVYLARAKRVPEARKQYEEALRLAPESIEINYNAGLFFADQGELERAKKLAEVAYNGGHPLPGLRNKIAAAEARKR